MKREQTLAFQIKSLNNQIKRMLDRTAIASNEANLTGMQYAILGYTTERGEDADVFQRDIEAEFNIRRSTASGMLQILERDGYIERIGVPGDARLKKIVLTGRAKDLEKHAHQKIEALQARLTQGISREELDQFYAVLMKMLENTKDAERQEWERQQ